MNSWYSIKAQADDDFEIAIYDEIGFWGVTAKQFINDFKRIPADARVSLRINSPGGDVFDSLAIHNVIKRHAGEVTGTIDGIAASGASIIAMAAKHLSMPENTFMMIHNSSGLALGNAEDMRDLADILEKIDSGLVATYVARTGQTPEKIAEMLSDETWLTAKEAKDLGFADEVLAPVAIAARASFNRFKNLPESLKEAAGICSVPSQAITASLSAEDIRAEAEKNARDIVALCTKAGVPEAATNFLDKGLKPDEVKAKLADADKIRARCVAAKLPERANNYIKAGLSVNEVANDLFDVLLARQSPEIANHLVPEAEREEAKPKKFATSAEIYALRNKRK